MKEIAEIQNQIKKINERNKRVEAEKAWETSIARKIYIMLTTYIVIALLMYFLDIEKPLINAIIPSIAYFLSTSSVGFVKSWWIRRKYERA